MDRVYCFTTDGELESSFEVTADCNSLVWDWDNRVFWCGTPDGSLIRYDRNGVERGRLRVRSLPEIVGLAYRQNNPDGNLLYALTYRTVGDRGVYALLQIDPETHEDSLLSNLDCDEIQQLHGCYITDELDEYSVVLMTTAKPLRGSCRVEIYQLDADNWMSVSQDSGILTPDESADLILTVCTGDLSVGEHLGELSFCDEAAQIKTSIPVTIDISQPVKIEWKTPIEFGINSVYPNPFNSTTLLSVNLPMESFVDMILYDIHVRVVHKFSSRKPQSGAYPILIDLRNESGGIYFAQITANDRQQSYSEVVKLINLK